MSKKNTWRIWASSGSISSAATVERYPDPDSGTVNFSSTVSAFFVRARSLEISSADSGAGPVLVQSSWAS